MGKKKEKKDAELKSIIRGTVLYNKPEDDLWIYNDNWGVWLKNDDKPGYALFEKFLGHKVVITIVSEGKDKKHEAVKNEKEV